MLQEILLEVIHTKNRASIEQNPEQDLRPSLSLSSVAGETARTPSQLLETGVRSYSKAYSHCTY